MFFLWCCPDTPFIERWGLFPLFLNLGELWTMVEKTLFLRADRVTGDAARFSWDTHPWNPATTLGESLSSLWKGPRGKELRPVAQNCSQHVSETSWKGTLQRPCPAAPADTTWGKDKPFSHEIAYS